MTQKEKQLLLKDLCARLSYETWVQYDGKEWLVTGYGHGRVSLLPSVFSSIGGPCPLVEEVRLYLRPMSSMTEEEEKEFNEIIGYKGVDVDGCTRCDNVHTMYGIYIPGISNLIDWLLAHHFDYRGLIPMGLALEAKEGMYKTE